LIKDGEDEDRHASEEDVEDLVKDVGVDRLPRELGKDAKKELRHHHHAWENM
jgi:hypothetical protein